MHTRCPMLIKKISEENLFLILETLDLLIQMELLAYLQSQVHLGSATPSAVLQ